MSVEQNRVNKFVNSLRDRQARRCGDGGTRRRRRPRRPAASRRPATRGFRSADARQAGALGIDLADGRRRLSLRQASFDAQRRLHRLRRVPPVRPGDDIRLLDWRHYAQTDRYYVKRYDDETNLQALLIVDASGSMDFGMSTVSKWRYAQMAAASLAHLLLRQRDSVGLALVGKQLLDFVKPQPRASHLARLLDLVGRGAAGRAVVVAGRACRS